MWAKINPDDGTFVFVSVLCLIWFGDHCPRLQLIDYHYLSRSRVWSRIKFIWFNIRWLELALHSILMTSFLTNMIKSILYRVNFYPFSYSLLFFYIFNFYAFNMGLYYFLFHLLIFLLFLFSCIFFRIGFSIATKPWLWLIISLCLNIVCGLGLLLWKEEIDEIELYVPMDSVIRKDASWVKEHFRDDLRHESIIVAAPNVLDPEVLRSVHRRSWIIRVSTKVLFHINAQFSPR